MNPGDTQSMVLKDTDNGPFWMSREEQENTRHDKVIQDKTKMRTLWKDQLKKLCKKKVCQQQE
jgi:hypothetical protein